MTLLKSIEVENFRCFRRAVNVPLAGGTYLVGVNDSGKTSVLSAVRCFFDSAAYSPSFLNQTERASRRRYANRSRVSIAFSLEALPTRGKRRQRLIEAYGQELVIDKFFTTREISRAVAVDYKVGNRVFAAFDDLPRDLQDLLRSVSVSYIHPQEGDILLAQAQEKLKARLLTNWGRHATIAKSLQNLEKRWNDLREMADRYLSAALTESLQTTWPDSRISIALPEKINDIVAVADIMFTGSPGLPDVSLTSHGTGAQSTILYHTHYLLDSDRTLHQGLYFPVWLLEEPESFLHADIALKLGALLNSEKWLSNIQMVVSTHSPLILATTKAQESAVNWVVVDNHQISRSKLVEEWSLDEVRELGVLMGDAAFEAYFYGSGLGDTLYLEDVRDLTRSAFSAAGFSIGPPLSGVTDIKKYVDVIATLRGVAGGRSFFLVDDDEGKKHLKDILARATKLTDRDGYTLLQVTQSLYLIVLPAGAAAEDLYAEFDDVLTECQNAVFVDGVGLSDTVPAHLTRAFSALRARNPVTTAEVRAVLRKQQDVKDVFWQRVTDESLELKPASIEAIQGLMELAP